MLLRFTVFASLFLATTLALAQSDEDETSDSAAREPTSSGAGTTIREPSQPFRDAAEQGDDLEDDRPRLSDRAELDRIIELYMAGEYESCSRELNALLDEANSDRFKDRGVIEKGRL
jgi:hypothetical protein